MFSIGALFILSGVLSFAQTVTPIEIMIDFPFEAGQQKLTPGKYAFSMPAQNVVSVSGPGGRATMTVITLLGRHDDDTTLELVFDKVGEEYLLSEVWFPGKDGCLTLSTAHEHKHRVLGSEAHAKK
jgi:hypothetical protein